MAELRIDERTLRNKINHLIRLYYDNLEKTGHDSQYLAGKIAGQIELLEYMTGTRFGYDKRGLFWHTPETPMYDSKIVRDK